MRQLLLGLDLGSSSVKASLLEADTGVVHASESFPKNEMRIDSPSPGWAEQDPELWWSYTKEAIASVLSRGNVIKGELKAIGIAYQMHGLVLVDRDMNVLRSSIIWCDSRATEIGDKAFKEMGEEYCLSNLLNSPGNFTASKLRWVIENQPELCNKIYMMMLPGDFLAMKLTGEICTSETGLSEGILWDFPSNQVSKAVLENYQIEEDWIPKVLLSFSDQGKVTLEASKETGLEAGIPITYRAGDQPNNAFSLNVLNPGELATTAGTSGTVYGVSSKPLYDPKSRVNTFVHVNHEENKHSYGVLLCVNGTGILNSWLKKNVGDRDLSYHQMNQSAKSSSIGANGLVFLPFGNGAERILENRVLGAQMLGLDLLRHDKNDLQRAAQEGIVSALTYGFDIMKDMGLNLSKVKAGRANMFLSPVFRSAFIHMNEVELEFYNTDGAQGAARGAGLGAGIYRSETETFESLELLETFVPNPNFIEPYKESYLNWKEKLTSLLNG